MLPRLGYEFLGMGEMFLSAFSLLGMYGHTFLRPRYCSVPTP